MGKLNGTHERFASIVTKEDHCKAICSNTGSPPVRMDVRTVHWIQSTLNNVETRSLGR